MNIALPPDRPVSPKVLRNTAIAVVLGFMLMVIGTLFYNGISAAVARDSAGER